GRGPADGAAADGGHDPWARPADTEPAQGEERRTGGQAGGRAGGQVDGADRAGGAGRGPADDRSERDQPSDAPQRDTPAATRGARRPADFPSPGGARATAGTAPEPPAWMDEDPDDAASPDDPDDDTPELAGTELLQRELGATVIEQIRHD
ncbi:hypothetical protein INN71_17855, partial [Nocardioides sp. ChNu-153]|nr:hypothetical protein [Nocardioides sp. ChNu-99]MDN7123250.1 hypothetical protein [Nocardioides sp. ChNu-153]